MAGESNVRFYDSRTNERVSHTPKAAHKDDDIPNFVWDVEDERYKKITSGDVFDGDTQQVIPSHATPVRILSAERYWEALQVDGEQIAYPSVTQLSNVLANDGVVKWQVNNVINFYTDIILEMMSGDEEATEEQKKFAMEYKSSALAASSPSDAAERGTRFHSAMELNVQGEDWTRVMLDHEVEPCGKIIQTIEEELGKRHPKGSISQIETSGVNKELGVAGSLDRRIDNTVYDYKFSDKTVFGKRGGLLKAKWCFPERALQLANYADIAKIEDPVLCSIFCNVHTGDVAFYDWPDVNRWIYSARLLNMFYYMYKLGRFPALGDNTAMIMHALEEWQHGD